MSILCMEARAERRREKCTKLEPFIIALQKKIKIQIKKIKQNNNNIFLKYIKS